MADPISASGFARARRCPLVVLLLIFVLPSAAVAASPVSLSAGASGPPELAITFEEAAVLAADLTPGGEALFFSLARVPLGYTHRVERRVDSVLVDALGEALYEMADGEPVPFQSVWAVADLTTGAYAIAVPEGFSFEESPFPGNAFQVGAPGLLNRLRHTFPWVDMVLIRPGVGAWTLQASDGSGTDADGAVNGRTVTRLGDGEPVGRSPAPPDRFQADDVVVVIDPRRLRFYATRLTGTPGGAS